MSGNAKQIKWRKTAPKKSAPKDNKHMRIYMFGYRDVVFGNGFRKDYDRRYTEAEQRMYEWGRQWAQEVRALLNLGPTDEMPDWDPMLRFGEAMVPVANQVGRDVYNAKFDAHDTWMKSTRVANWLTV